MRRRRASGGPAEQAFATLVGLELRPRRVREAAALWDGLLQATDVTTRDRVWDHRTSCPTAATWTLRPLSSPASQPGMTRIHSEALRQVIADEEAAGDTDTDESGN